MAQGVLLKAETFIKFKKGNQYWLGVFPFCRLKIKVKVEGSKGSYCLLILNDRQAGLVSLSYLQGLQTIWAEKTELILPEWLLQVIFSSVSTPLQVVLPTLLECTLLISLLIPNGRHERTWTADFYRVEVALYQLSYAPAFCVFCFLDVDE